MKNLSNWRSVRVREAHVEHDLRQRHWLRLHGLCIGTVVMGVMWGISHLQMLLGQDRVALRYLVTLGVGYLVYLLVLRMWASSLVRRDSSHMDIGGDLPIPVSARTVDSPFQELPIFQSGAGGNFGGGGSTGDFSGAAESSDVLSNVTTGALEAAAGADEGAVVAIPVVAIFLIGCALVLGAGSLLMLYFGWEALLTVAVELAFSVAAGAGEGPITHTEIAAWQGNTGIVLDGWEARLLRQLSLSYLSESHKAMKADCPAPWADAPYLKPAVNQVANQMRAAMRELQNL